LKKLMLFLSLYFILNTFANDWWVRLSWICKYFPSGYGFLNGPEYYSCGYRELLFKTTLITSSSSCNSDTECFLDSTVFDPEVCIGTYCEWYKNSCFCHYIENPFSATDGCNACKFDTPSPTFTGECECTGTLGFGLIDSKGHCLCDVELLDGGDCYGGIGTGSLDMHIVPFVEESCYYDTFTGLYRTITCYDFDTLDIDWFYDDSCSTLSYGYKIHNDTCYYDSGVQLSAEPTRRPTVAPVHSEAPTPGPTMTDSPTLSPIVLDNSMCNYAHIFLSVNRTIYEAGDRQWIEDCLYLYQTLTSRLDVTCGCFGKFTRKMANKYLNCVLVPPYHALTIWNMCHYSIYAQSCGSKCTRRLRRRLQSDEELDQPRRGVAKKTFKLVWSEDVCEGRFTTVTTPEPTGSPTGKPTLFPTGKPTFPPECADRSGLIPASDDCMCDRSYCNRGEFCITATANSTCYSDRICPQTDGSMVGHFSCVCGSSGVLCDIDEIGFFLCDETASTPCIQIDQCSNSNGTAMNLDWCRCQELTTCNVNQYCDAKHGWCSYYPTCEDLTGATTTAVDCSCGIANNICKKGQYCKSSADLCMETAIGD